MEGIEKITARIAQDAQAEAGRLLAEAEAKAQAIRADAQAQAREIVVDAHAQAKEAREKALRDSQRELKRIASEAAGKLAFHKDDDPFDSFLDLAEGGTKHESR